MEDENNTELTGYNRSGKDRTDEFPYKIGQWYWFPEDDDAHWFGCVQHIGSNYVLLENPRKSSRRVHFDDMHKCRLENDPKSVIAKNIAEQKNIISNAMKSIQALTSKLAIGSTKGADTQALTCYKGSSMESYKSALVKARDEDLPELFKKIKDASEEMTVWMSAEMLPMQAEVDRLESSKNLIKSRIFGVELYAGLVESIQKIQDGVPASPEEPVHLYQRRHYMDEECLVNYEVGGMTFKEISDFEDWLLRPENLSRIMPFPRTIVAFRVRRDKKEDLTDFVKFFFGGGKDENMTTFLYLKNGDQIYRLETGIEFKEKLFPDLERVIYKSGSLYAVRDCGRIERLATEGEYLELLRAEEKEKREYEKLPDDEKWKWWRSLYSESTKWIPWDPSSVFYDDITDFVKEEMESHNRLVLILQGVFDRSSVFTPHPPYKLWSPEDFSKAFKLIYDNDRAISSGSKPDFEAYQKRVNAHFTIGSISTGQHEVWHYQEAIKHYQRSSNRDTRFGISEELFIKYYKSDDVGPGITATVTSLRPGKTCTFEWTKYSTKYPRYGSSYVKSSHKKITISMDKLLCVDGYKPGDYHIFFDDPRTRADYLKWAPLLLRAEEWHMSRLKKWKGIIPC